MSMTISQRKLPGFTDQPQNTTATISKKGFDLSSKEVGEAQRINDFERVIPAHISTVQWCIGDKSILIGEIDLKLHLIQWNQKYNLATHVMLDFMSTIRLMSLGKCPDMGAAIYAIIMSAFPTCPISFILYLTPTSICH